MKNVHVLPTDKPSRLIVYSKLLNEFRLLDEPIEDWKHKRNIYITSDEEIKEADYVTNGEYTSQAINEWWTKFYIGNPELEADYWKIILTTDQDLIKDGVQAIDDEFLEWFVKNPSCEEIEVIKMFNMIQLTSREYIYYTIIPKEEPIQETLEEAAKKYYEDNIDQSNIPREHYEFEIQDLMIGFTYEWQVKKIYSEEDMKKAFYQGSTNSLGLEWGKNRFDEWFEEFKNKQL